MPATLSYELTIRSHIEMSWVRIEKGGIGGMHTEKHQLQSKEKNKQLMGISKDPQELYTRAESLSEISGLKYT